MRTMFPIIVTGMDGAACSAAAGHSVQMNHAMQRLKIWLVHGIYGEPACRKNAGITRQKTFAVKIQLASGAITVQATGN